jgi:hypothetical protein
MPNLRLTLASTIETRAAGNEKDTLISNGLVEKESDELLYTIKRPGTINKITGAGTANGIFVYGLNIYTWDSSRANTNPVITLLSSL